MKMVSRKTKDSVMWYAIMPGIKDGKAQDVLTMFHVTMWLGEGFSATTSFPDREPFKEHARGATIEVHDMLVSGSRG